MLPPLTVAVLVLADSTAIVPVGVAELIKKAMAFVGQPPARRIEVLLVGAERTVLTAGGYPVICDVTMAELQRCDVVIASALDPDVVAHIDLNRPAVAFLKAMWAKGADLVSACTGAFLLAETGALDGRRATTHWAFQPLFRRRYPNVELVPQAILVDQGRVCTAGGATSFIQMTHYLIERWLGREAAGAAARMFLIDPNKSPQGAYATFASQRQHADEAVLRAQDMIEAAASEPTSIQALARAVAMAERTFLRRFKHATGNTPREYQQRVRVEAAKRALESGPASIKEIAAAVGYGDAAAFRLMFRRITGLGPAEYRRRYGPRGDVGFADPPALAAAE